MSSSCFPGEETGGQWLKRLSHLTGPPSWEVAENPGVMVRGCGQAGWAGSSGLAQGIRSMAALCLQLAGASGSICLCFQVGAS